MKQLDMPGNFNLHHHQIPFVLSTINGIVREVYRVHQWLETEDKKRSYFEGEVAETSIR